MKILVKALIIGLALASPFTSFGLSDAKIKSLLIQQSQAGYSGSCPCPDNVDRGGRRCGKRSAYSKPGGASPLCYASDVTPQMVIEFKSRNASQ